MKRPLGVILTCITLGLLAAAQLVVAASMAFGALAIRHPARPSASVPPTPGAVFIVLIVIVLFTVGTAVWSVATLAGLAILRSWARISAMAIGGCLVAFGVLMILGTAITAAAMSKTSQPANLPPHMMQGILAFYGILSAAIVAIGIWWLVYFNLRSVKPFFLPQYATDPYLAAPYLAAQSPYPNNPYAPQPYAAQPYPAIPPSAHGHDSAPVPIVVLACLLFFGSACSLLCTFLSLSRLPLRLHPAGLCRAGHLPFHRHLLRSHSLRPHQAG